MSFSAGTEDDDHRSLQWSLHQAEGEAARLRELVERQERYLLDLEQELHRRDQLKDRARIWTLPWKCPGCSKQSHVFIAWVESRLYWKTSYAALQGELRKSGIFLKDSKPDEPPPPGPDASLPEWQRIQGVKELNSMDLPGGVGTEFDDLLGHP